MKSFKAIILFILSLSALIGAEYYTPSSDSSHLLTTAGEIKSANPTIISTPRNWGLSYQIIYLAKEGSYVSRGDTIVVFDPHEVLNDIKEGQRTLREKILQKQIIIKQNEQIIESIKNRIIQSEIQVDISKNRLDQAQYSSDNERKNIQLDLEKAKLTLEKQKQNLASQKILNRNELESIMMEINKARVHLESLQRKLNDMTILAPTDGLVVHFTRRGSAIKLKKGDNVSPGQPISRIPDLENMIVSVDLNEVDRLKVTPGQSATIEVEAYPDTNFTGAVEYISKIVEFDYSESSLKTYPVRVFINSDKNYRLKPGLTARVKITVENYPSCFKIPSWCLFKTGSRFSVQTKEGDFIPVDLIKIGEGSAFIKGKINTETKLLPNQGIPNF